MPATSLLNIDINKLFEENSISEIKTTQTKLQAENERKRVELRTLVGERYRDLIDAADTISDMKVTADGVIGHIEKMSAKCQELQHQHLIGFKLDSDQTVPVPSQNITNKSYYAIGIQIKILIDMPEQIWCAVEKEEFLLGTQLFLFARHINTGLQLHTGGEKSEGSLTGKFPIVSRQWSAISHFREALLDRCQSKLLSSNLTENVRKLGIIRSYLFSVRRVLEQLEVDFIDDYSAVIGKKAPTTEKYIPRSLKKCQK